MEHYCNPSNFWLLFLIFYHNHTIYLIWERVYYVFSVICCCGHKIYNWESFRDSFSWVQVLRDLCNAFCTCPAAVVNVIVFLVHAVKTCGFVLPLSWSKGSSIIFHSLKTLPSQKLFMFIMPVAVHCLCL